MYGLFMILFYERRLKFILMHNKLTTWMCRTIGVRFSMIAELHCCECIHGNRSESELSYWMNWSWINEVYLWTGAYNEAIVGDKLVFIILVFVAKTLTQFETECLRGSIWWHYKFKEFDYQKLVAFVHGIQHKLTEIFIQYASKYPTNFMFNVPKVSGLILLLSRLLLSK